MRKDCCIVIITHKEKLEGNDLWSFEKVIRVFSQRRDIKLIIPENITTSFYERYSDFIDIQKVSTEWLDSLRSYNEMCCTTEFYDMFSDYEYILICQTDVFIFKDELDYFMELGYDWYGAPWPHLKDKVGNGGLSLRKVSKMREIVEKNKFNHKSIGGSEDTWFCINHENELNICPLDVACNFSLENIKDEYLGYVNDLPMGLHSKYTYHLWDEDGKKFMELKNSKKENKTELKVALCCIGRLENKYIREYVEYHKRIGIDKIFLYDNNYGDEERFEDVISDYIDSGIVEVTDYRNKEKSQLAAYQDCYDKHGSEYDWICYFDVDEFFTFSKKMGSVKDYLSHERFNGFDMIHLNWVCYGDNDLVRYEDKPVIQRFKMPIVPLDFKRTYDFPENNHIKTIIRGGLKDVKWLKTPHTPICGGIKCCNNAGIECNPDSPFNQYDFTLAYLRHYQTKTIEEFYTNKVKRGYPDGNKGFFETHSWVTNFFKSNKQTQEKLDYLNEISNNEDKLDLFICTHKDFDPPVKNPCYKIANAKDINNDTAENGLPGSFYSEILIYFDIAKRKDLKDYVGFCHYRKYFSFMDNIPIMDDSFKECDVIAVKPKKFNGSIKGHYAKWHNVEDLEIVEYIIGKKYPDYKEFTERYFNEGKLLLPCNMFIMKRDDFIKYVDFIKDVLDEYLNVVGMDIEKRIEDNKDKYLKDIEKFPQNGEVWYQYRIGGYLAERLTSLYILKNFSRIKVFRMIETEGKYETEK